MKKTLCLVLSLCMVVCFSIVSWADTHVYTGGSGWNGGTDDAANGQSTVTYDASALAASYTVTIPSTIAAAANDGSPTGQQVSCAITASDADKVVTVSVTSETVTLTNTNTIVADLFVNKPTVSAGVISADANGTFVPGNKLTSLNRVVGVFGKYGGGTSHYSYIFSRLQSAQPIWYSGSYSGTVQFGVTYAAGSLS